MSPAYFAGHIVDDPLHVGLEVGLRVLGIAVQLLLFLVDDAAPRLACSAWDKLAP